MATRAMPTSGALLTACTMASASEIEVSVVMPTRGGKVIAPASEPAGDLPGCATGIGRRCAPTISCALIDIRHVAPSATQK